MQAIFRSELIWVVFQEDATTGAELPFQEQPLLRGVHIMGIEAVQADMLTQTPDQEPVAPNLTDFVVTLNDGSDQRYRRVPCFSLFAPANGGIWKETVPYTGDWQKSRVKYVGTAVLEAAVAVPFIVYYATDADLAAWARIRHMFQ